MKQKLLQTTLAGILGTSAITSGAHFASRAVIATEEAVYAKYLSFRGKIADKVLVWDGRQTSTDVDINGIVSTAARKYRLSESLLHAIIKHESSYNPSAQSKVGAIGLMQIMPANAKRCNTRMNKLWDEATNINCGAQIIKEELQTYKNPEKALQAYNGGPRAVGKYPESIRYSKEVLASAGIYELTKGE